MKMKSVGIVGTGPAALMAGTILLENDFKVVFFDQKKTPARKFLVAGNGGFNLTNDEEISMFLNRYNSDIIKKAVVSFDNNDFRNFLSKIGIETFVGSSGKIFPLKGIKPIEVLKAWQEYLIHLGATFKMGHFLNDFNEDELFFESKGTINAYKFDYYVFALGGNSWSITGSDGNWLNMFVEKGIECVKFESSNSGFELLNHDSLKEFAGKSIKNCKVFSDNDEKFGELVMTEYGIEGPPVYAINPYFRNGHSIYIDFKPTMNIESIEQKLINARNSSEGLRDLKLPKVVIAWLKLSLNKVDFQNKRILSETIKKFELNVTNLRPIEEVISTIGGINMNSINDSFQLKKLTKAYGIGEMLDWDAPTGGYLIQGCVSSGHAAANSIISHS
jgi:uncharacterized flavoprotein (TIGR03862 family)